MYADSNACWQHHKIPEDIRRYIKKKIPEDTINYTNNNRPGKDMWVHSYIRHKDKCKDMQTDQDKISGWLLYSNIHLRVKYHDTPNAYLIPWHRIR